MSAPAAFTETQARRLVAGTWVAGALVFLLLAFLLGRHYGAYPGIIEAWYRARVLPTALLMVGGIVADYSRGVKRTAPADRLLYRCLVGASAAYFVMLLVVGYGMWDEKSVLAGDTEPPPPNMPDPLAFEGVQAIITLLTGAFFAPANAGKDDKPSGP